MIPKKDRYYALYKGESLLAHGTIEEISLQTDKTVSFLSWLTSPSAKKRAKQSERLLMIEVEAIE